MRYQSSVTGPARSVTGFSKSSMADLQYVWVRPLHGINNQGRVPFDYLHNAIAACCVKQTRVFFVIFMFYFYYYCDWNSIPDRRCKKRITGRFKMKNNKKYVITASSVKIKIEIKLFGLDYRTYEAFYCASLFWI